MPNEWIYNCLSTNDWDQIISEFHNSKMEQFVMTSYWCKIQVTAERFYNMQSRLNDLFEPYIGIKNAETAIPLECLRIIILEMSTEKLKDVFQNVGEENFQFQKNEYTYMNMDITYRSILNETVLYLSSRFDLVILINKKLNSIIILGDNDRILLKAARITIRDYYYLSLVENGWVELRASAYVDEFGKANLYIGESNSGKTTLLINALSKEKNNFMANGRVFIKVENGKLYAVGTPESIALRGFTYELFSQFIDLKEEFINANKENKRLKLSLKDFCKYLRTRITVTGEVDYIVLAKLENITTVDEIDKYLLYEYIEKTDIYGISRLKERYWLNIFTYNEKRYMENVQEIRNALKITCKNIAYRDNEGICMFKKQMEA